MPDDGRLDLAASETDVPFGRSRLLKALGVALFSSVISACHGGPGGGCGIGPCTGRLIDQCQGCNSGACPGCTANDNYCHFPGSGIASWCTCYNGQTWMCFDWTQGGSGCYCTHNLGTPC